ncbi:MAG: uridine diphosphate-N-acetylglucosamine-binding protein YvcK [Terriglobales bacterium]
MSVQKPRPAIAETPRRGIKVVAIGGGTGLSTLLRGLKRYVLAPGARPRLANSIRELSAVVTVTDDGGSSGKLRKEFNMLPPGDIRNCIVALSEDEALLARLFQFRFPGESALSGHSVGNLFLTALTAMTGDFAEAVNLSSAILATRGTIYPATTANVQLEAAMDDGSVVKGETNITASTKRIVELRLVPSDVTPVPQTLEAIASADLITIGPGSLFTSLVPNLLVRGIPEAIMASRAVKVFICNLMTEANESLGLTASGHIRALYKHAGCRFLDYALVNRKPVSDAMKAQYALEGASQIVADVPEIEALGVRPVLGDFLEEAAVARHAHRRVARVLMRMAAGAPSLPQVRLRAPLVPKQKVQDSSQPPLRKPKSRVKVSAHVELE